MSSVRVHVCVCVWPVMNMPSLVPKGSHYLHTQKIMWGEEEDEEEEEYLYQYKVAGSHIFI